MTLIVGTGKLYYADKWILVDRPALLFSNPLVPYAWESVSEEQKGMFCIFNEQFVRTEEKDGSLANTPLFRLTGDKVFFLDDVELVKVQNIYARMQEELQSDYAGKSDQYLQHTHRSISEIAFSLGFESISYFSKFYRKHTDQSPTKVREQAIPMSVTDTMSVNSSL